MQWKSVSPNAKRRSLPFNNENLTWARETDSPRTLRKKFEALEELERQLGLAALWQHARINDDREPINDDDDEEEEIYFQAPKRKKQATMFLEEESDISVHNFNEESDISHVATAHSNRHNHSAKRFDDEIFSLPSDAEVEEYSNSNDSDSSFDDTPIKKSRARVKRSVKKADSTTTNSAAIKPKTPYKKSSLNPDDPTFTRIPSKPIPATWCTHIHNPLRMNQNNFCLEVESTDLCSGDWLPSIASKSPTILGAYINPPPGMPAEELVNKLTPLLPRLFTLKCGYLFIWCPRAQMASLLKAADKRLGYRYVENLCWIKKGLNNRPLLEDTTTTNIIAESKQTLLILKRDPSNQIKLRHQRNADCIFDYCAQGRKPDARVYDVIETLIRPVDEDSPQPYLIHLWAGGSATDRLVLQSRHRWIRVYETIARDESSTDRVEATVDSILHSTIHSTLHSTLHSTVHSTSNQPESSSDPFSKFITSDPFV